MRERFETLQAEILFCRRRECEERAAVERAQDSCARDAHFALAERYADRAWSLTEKLGAVPPSGTTARPAGAPVTRTPAQTSGTELWHWIRRPRSPDAVP